MIAVIYYNFRHTFVPYGVEAQWVWGNEGGLLNLPNLWEKQSLFKSLFLEKKTNLILANFMLSHCYHY